MSEDIVLKKRSVFIYVQEMAEDWHVNAMRSEDLNEEDWRVQAANPRHMPHETADISIEKTGLCYSTRFHSFAW